MAEQEQKKPPDRALMLALYRAGKLLDYADQFLPDEHGYTTADMQECLDSDEFQDFCKQYTATFIEGIDGFLLGRLQQLSDDIGRCSINSPGYAALYREYRQLLDRTQPIIDRITRAKSKNESRDAYNNLLLRIEGCPYPEERKPRNTEQEGSEHD